MPDGILATTIAIVGTLIGVIVKTLWDRYWKQKDEYTSLIRTKRIQLIERQLSELYWPLYIRLERNSAAWEKLIYRSNMVDKVRRTVAEEIDKNFILPNHEEIFRLLEKNIYLARADRELFRQMKLYMRHVAVYKALRSAGINDTDPVALGEPWPVDFFPLVAKKTEELQAEYDQLLSSVD